MKEQKLYLVGEAAEKAGLTLRTFRNYVAQRIIPGPIGSCKQARYTEDHIRKARKVKSLVANGRTLKEAKGML